jgi:hypothetical protein
MIALVLAVELSLAALGPFSLVALGLSNAQAAAGAPDEDAATPLKCTLVRGEGEFDPEPQIVRIGPGVWEYWYPSVLSKWTENHCDGDANCSCSTTPNAYQATTTITGYDGNPAPIFKRLDRKTLLLTETAFENRPTSGGSVRYLDASAMYQCVPAAPPASWQRPPK